MIPMESEGNRLKEKFRRSQKDVIDLMCNFFSSSSLLNLKRG